MDVPPIVRAGQQSVVVPLVPTGQSGCSVLLHAEEVTGSIPVSPTQLKATSQLREVAFLLPVQQRCAAIIIAVDLANAVTAKLGSAGLSVEVWWT